MRPKRQRVYAKSGAERQAKKGKSMYSVAYNPYTGVVPSRRTVNLRYCEYFDLVDAAVGWAGYVFRANSVYDPNYTGVGHQPLGRDQLAALYDHYRVKKATIRVYCTQQQATVPTMITCGPTQVATLVGPTLAEYPGAKSVMLSQDTSGPNNKVIKLDLDIGRFDGDVLHAKTNDSLAAPIGGNPTDEIYFQIIAHNPSSAVTVDARLFVQIDYMVEFWGRQDLTQS